MSWWRLWKSSQDTDSGETVFYDQKRAQRDVERFPRRQRRKEETGKILGLSLCFLSQGWGLQSGREPVLLQHACPHSLVLSSLDAPPVEVTGLHCFLFSTVLTIHLDRVLLTSGLRGQAISSTTAFLLRLSQLQMRNSA